VLTRRRWLWLLGIATVALFVLLAVVDGQIKESGGPGIVPFELAGSTERATEILGEWGERGRDSARLSLGLDFLFLIAYGAFFWLAVLAIRDAARRRGWNRYARPGATVALLAILAAACDTCENIGLLLVVNGHADSAAPTVATGFALAKFVTLGVAQLYLLAGLAALAVDRLRPPNR
jgi:hypothetical protein